MDPRQAHTDDGTIERMKVAAIGLLCLGLALNHSLLAQVPAKAVTVPVTLDHNRIVIDVYVPLKDGTTKRLRGLLDTGSTDILISLHLAQLLDKNATCATEWCSVAPPAAIVIGGMTISLTGISTARMPARPAAFNDVLIPGMSPEVILPSTILKNYDLVIDYANRQFVIGPPGSMKFSGTPIPMKVNRNGRITLGGRIESRRYEFWLNTGRSATLVSPSLLDRWHQEHPNWPYAVGALGIADMKDGPEEMHREMMRLPAVDLGPTTLRDVLVASSGSMAQKPAMADLGAEAFKGSRIGIDYAHSTLYVEQVNSALTPGLDVVGLTLRPEVDGRYTVVAVVPFDGQPSVPDVRAGDVLIGVDGAPVTGASLGQVWSLLGGAPGQVRKLIVERDGKRLAVDSTVRRFLAAKAN
jgi:hypothetical protein